VDIEKIKTWFNKEWHMPYSQKVSRVIGTFSLTEKVIFYFSVFVFAVSALVLLYKVNQNFLVEVPDHGGSFTEGILGSPRFINPLLAVGDIDKDLSSLVYSGLLKTDSSGNLTPDLAEKYTISEDGLTYTFTIKDNVYFHDGAKVTTDDIAFTIEKAKDPLLKSPREANWAGVRVEVVDEKTIIFHLKQPYAPFIQNATLGILPKHLWNTTTIEEFPFSQFNISPVGSGPYKIDSITYSSGGFPSDYRLQAYKKYSLGEPYITTINIKSYKTEKDILDAYKNGRIESIHGYSKSKLENFNEKSSSVIQTPLPRIFGVFFNQNVAPVLVYREVREALNIAIDKQYIIDNVIDGSGQIIDSPVPKVTDTETLDQTTPEERIEKAKNLLIQKKWVQNEDGVFEKKDGSKTVKLEFSISTGSAPELKESALILQEQWQKMGALVEVKIFDIGDLNQNIIKTRKYDALLFGAIIGRDMDLYPFWHSSQRNSPGLNIAMYTNIKADKVLENIRKTSDKIELNEYFKSFEKEIRSDLPAVFTYSPYFTYIVPKKIKNINVGGLVNPHERFSEVNEWYVETNKVWKIFSNDNNN